jgi:hypothetical protein
MAKSKASSKKGKSGKQRAKPVATSKKVTADPRKAKATVKKRPAAVWAKGKPVAPKKAGGRSAMKATPPAAPRTQVPPKATSRIGELCDAILALHVRAKTPMASAFLPGLSDGEIDALMKPTGLRLPQSARDLYKWRNGVDRKKKGGYVFFYRMQMFPLHEQIKYSYAGLCEVREDFNKNWFPLFDTVTADRWAIDCNSPHAVDAPIIDFDNESIDHPQAFSTLEQCLRCMLAAFEQGVLGFGELTMDIDSKRFGKLMAKLNPEVAESWKSLG